MEVKEPVKFSGNFKIEQVDFYNRVDDFTSICVDGNSLNSNGCPEYVQFDAEPYPYEKAYECAVEELSEMFKDCKSYEDARSVITSIDRGNLFSSDNGHCAEKDTTGRLYCEWAVVWGDDKAKAVFWDVRWY